MVFRFAHGILVDSGFPVLDAHDPGVDGMKTPGLAPLPLKRQKKQQQKYCQNHQSSLHKENAPLRCHSTFILRVCRLLRNHLCVKSG